ncbi:MAG TPA: hypothetical protein VMU19_14605 [Bryobacteraceae bacterium]|nr:hypothetical protein [Bryobacteraceae bacterium]
MPATRSRLLMESVLNAMLVCHHRRTTFPVTPRFRNGPAPRRTYIVCLDCGAELPYDWSRMKVVAAGDSGGGVAPDRLAALKAPATGAISAAADGARPPAPNGIAREDDGGDKSAARDGLHESRQPARLRPEAPAAAEDPPAAVRTLTVRVEAVRTVVEIPAASVAKQATAPDAGAEKGAEPAMELASYPVRLSPAEEPKQQRRGANGKEVAAPHDATVMTRTAAAIPAPRQREAGLEAHHGAETAGGGQYLARAKLRLQQVQVALRVLNALMAGLSAQPDDVDKLRAWSDPSVRSSPARELALRVVSCAASV